MEGNVEHRPYTITTAIREFHQARLVTSSEMSRMTE
jgi:hypothetical protein